MNAEFGPAIDSQDVSAAFGDELDQSAGAEMLASDSGGFSVKNTNDLSRGFQRIADETKSYYLLGYRPTNTKTDGKFRKIEVKLARKDVKVRARKGYFAPVDAVTLAAQKKKPEAPGDPDIQAALDSPYEEKAIPLRMSAWVFDETLLGKANTIVATDVDIRDFAFKEENGRLVDAVEFLLVVAHLEIGRVLPLRPEGRHEAAAGHARSHAQVLAADPPRLRARRPARTRRRSWCATATAAAWARWCTSSRCPTCAKLRASSVILSDTLQPDKPGEKPRPTWWCAAPSRRARRSTRSSRCTARSARRARACPRCCAGYQIRREDGTVVSRGGARPRSCPPRSASSRAWWAPSLEGAQPGDYEFVLDLRDEIGGAIVEVREPFRVAPDGPTGVAPSRGP